MQSWQDLQYKYPHDIETMWLQAYIIQYNLKKVFTGNDT